MLSACAAETGAERAASPLAAVSAPASDGPGPEGSPGSARLSLRPGERLSLGIQALVGPGCSVTGHAEYAPESAGPRLGLVREERGTVAAGAGAPPGCPGRPVPGVRLTYTAGDATGEDRFVLLERSGQGVPRRIPVAVTIY